MVDREDSAVRLLLAIARCPIAVAGVAGSLERDHPCGQVVAWQRAPTTSFHVPEPWQGHLSRAPILFVSSNPSFNRNEPFPVWSWTDDSICEFFEDRFSERAASSGTNYWNHTRNRASELLGRPATPGVDFALTEAVHCKSRVEIGVNEALPTCAERYLRDTIAASGARIVVVFGRQARAALRLVFPGLPTPEAPPRSTVARIKCGGRLRSIVHLGHPSSGERKTFAACYTADTLGELRSLLAAPERDPAPDENA